jgi:hypothetical protein
MRSLFRALAPTLGVLTAFLFARAGLFVAPGVLARGIVPRVVVGVLMLPPAIVITLSALDGVQRGIAGNPISFVAMIVYVASSAVYVLAYVLLVCTALPARTDNAAVP